MLTCDALEEFPTSHIKVAVENIQWYIYVQTFDDIQILTVRYYAHLFWRQLIKSIQIQFQIADGPRSRFLYIHGVWWWSVWLCACMEWLRLVGSLKIEVSFAKEPCKKRRYSAKETCNLMEPTTCSHPIATKREKIVEMQCVAVWCKVLQVVADSLCSRQSNLQA